MGEITLSSFRTRLAIIQWSSQSLVAPDFIHKKRYVIVAALAPSPNFSLLATPNLRFPGVAEAPAGVAAAPTAAA